MQTPYEAIAEAKRALNEFMRRKGNGSPSRLGPPQRAFRPEGGSDTDFDNRDELGPILDEARESARRYAESKSKGVRPVRQIDETNQAAVEGRDSALAFIEKRRGRSRLKA